MSLRHPFVKSKKIWDQLFKLQLHLNLSDHDLSKKMGIKVSQFNTLKRGKHDIPAFAFIQCLDKLNIDPHVFLSDQLEYHLIKKSIKSFTQTLPNRYLAEANGTLATPKSFLDEFVRTHPLSQSVELFRALQITPESVLNPNQPVNILFSIDILNYFDRYQQAHFSAARFGHEGALASRPAGFDHSLKESLNSKQFFERAPTLINQYIEKNYVYEIEKLSHSGCTIRTKPSRETEHFIGRNSAIKSRFALLCEARRVFISALPKRLGLEPQMFKKTSCHFHGSDYCRFEASFKPHDAFRPLGFH